jgi:hypothetical protein
MGFLSGILGTKNTFQAVAPVNKYKQDQAQLDTSNYQPQIQQAGQNYQDVFGQQQEANQNLRDIATGKGPNPALAQLSQTTGQNINAAAGQAASARGVNPALQARMAVDAAGQGNSQASGQAATLAAQTQLGAQSQLAQNLQGQGGQATSLLGTAGGLQNQQNQGQIQNVLGAGQINAGVAGQNAALEQGAQQINAGVAAQNTETNAKLTGGLMNAAGGAMALSDERVKSDIHRGPGQVLPGVPEATFRYDGVPGKFRGVIAQDVERVRPDLVAQDAFGYKRVDPALGPHPMAQGGQVPGRGRGPVHLYLDSLSELHGGGGAQKMAFGGMPEVPDVQLQGDSFTPNGYAAEPQRPGMPAGFGSPLLSRPEYGAPAPQLQGPDLAAQRADWRPSSTDPLRSPEKPGAMQFAGAGLQGMGKGMGEGAKAPGGAGNIPSSVLGMEMQGGPRYFAEGGGVGFQAEQDPRTVRGPDGTLHMMQSPEDVEAYWTNRGQPPEPRGGFGGTETPEDVAEGHLLTMDTARTLGQYDTSMRQAMEAMQRHMTRGERAGAHNPPSDAYEPPSYANEEPMPEGPAMPARSGYQGTTNIAPRGQPPIWRVSIQGDPAPGRMARGGSPTFAGHGQVPGTPAVPGRVDTEANDKVPAMLSPEEIVLPRSVTKAPNAPEEARKFVEHLTRRSKGGGFSRVAEARRMAEGGPVEGGQGQEGADPGLVASLRSWWQAEAQEAKGKATQDVNEAASGALPDFLSARKAVKSKRTQLRQADEQTRE